MSSAGIVSFVVLLALVALMDTGITPSTSALWNEESAAMTFDSMGRSVSVEPISAPSINRSRPSFDPAPATGLLRLFYVVTKGSGLNGTATKESAITDSAVEDRIPAIGGPINEFTPKIISTPPNGPGSAPANGTGE